MKSHEKFLKKFIILFRQVDIDNNGIIDEVKKTHNYCLIFLKKEFQHLISVMDVGKDHSDIVRLLQMVDPYNNENITFSQCVTLFSAVRLNFFVQKKKFLKEMISKGNGTFSVLQKISMDGES